MDTDSVVTDFPNAKERPLPLQRRVNKKKQSVKDFCMVVQRTGG